MTIAVTGARGKIGRELVPLLERAGAQVRSLGRSSTPRFDWADTSSWSAAVEGATGLFLLMPGGDDGHRDVAAEVANGPAVVDAATAAGVQRVVLMTALGVDQAPDDVPLHALERHVRRRARSWTIVRPNWFFQNLTTGPLAGLIAAAGGELRVPLEDARVSYLDARDVAEVCARALLDPGHAGAVYDVTGPAALTMDEVAAAFTGRAGRAGRDAASGGWRYRPIDEASFRTEAAELGWDPAYIDTVCDLFTAMRAGWAEAVTDDVAAVLERPARSIDAFVADLSAAASDAGRRVPAGLDR